MDLSRFATQRFARTRFDLTANSSSFSLGIVSFIIVIIKIILEISCLKTKSISDLWEQGDDKEAVQTKICDDLNGVEPDGSGDLDIIFDGSYDLDVTPYGRDDLDGLKYDDSDGLDGVKPDGSDDNKVGNNAEDRQAHVQDDHQPALMMVTTIFNKTTSLTRLITIIMILISFVIVAFSLSVPFFVVIGNVMIFLSFRFHLFVITWFMRLHEVTLKLKLEME